MKRYTNSKTCVILNFDKASSGARGRMAGRENREAGARPARDRRRKGEAPVQYVTVGTTWEDEPER